MQPEFTYFPITREMRLSFPLGGLTQHQKKRLFRDLLEEM